MDRNEYARNWRKNNPYKSRLSSKKWREKNPDKVKERNSKDIWFTPLNKSIHLEYNPRKYICSICGFKGQTHLHHTQYDESDPLKHIVELCVGCHNRQRDYTNVKRNEKGQFVNT